MNLGRVLQGVLGENVDGCAVVRVVVGSVDR